MRFGIKNLLVLVLFLLVLFAVATFYQRSYPSDSVTKQTAPKVLDERIPKFLHKSFPNTNFDQANPSIEKIVSGGPSKDGIPAINEPNFESIQKFKHSDDIQAIVLKNGDQIKVYPYNILNWHEIVNDEIGGLPVAITFCPLCGSALVFDRSIGDVTTTFGVSGALIESNMVMFDRATESLWQQSTGEALAGTYVGERLSLVAFQVLTIGEIKEKFPNALILSEKTGYGRDYGRNPYSGYDLDNSQFIFSVSQFGDEFPAKAIMVVFRFADTVVTTPWLDWQDGKTKSVVVDTTALTLTKKAGEISITTPSGEEIPFYFEMWFSFAIQNKDSKIIII